MEYGAMERHRVDQGTTERDCRRGIFLSVFSTFFVCLLGDTFDTFWSTPRRPSHRIHRSWNSSTQLYIRSRWAHFRVLQGVGDASRTVFSRFQMWTFWQRRPCLKNPSHRRRSCHSPHRRCLHRRWKRSQCQLDKSQLPWDCPKSHRH